MKHAHIKTKPYVCKTELAASFRDREKSLMSELEDMKQRWEESLEGKSGNKLTKKQDKQMLISMISGIPVQRMAQAEGIRLKGMKEQLLAKVIAQDKAVDTLVKAIQRSRVGLKDPNKPIGTFLFLGLLELERLIWQKNWPSRCLVRQTLLSVLI